MPEYTLDTILADIRGEKTNDPYARSSSKIAYTPTKIDTGQIQDVQYNVHQDAIFDRLSDGTYVPKYENYKGATGNEDRLAKNQSGFEQLYKGLSKNLIKTGVYALDGTVGTLYGIVNAMDKGSWDGLYDNDFSNTLDDWNKELDYALPNYYSDEQKAKGVLGSMGTVNFWANDVAGGLAFVGGALLPEIALAAATGGTSAPASIAKLGLKTAIKTAGRKTLKTLGKEALEAGTKKAFKGIGEYAASGVAKQTGLNLIRSSRFAKAGNFIGETAKTAGFLVRTSNFEAGMEARHNLHQSTEEYLATFKELNGRQPTFEEFSDFMDKAKTAANWVYGTNMAILSVSNAAMFGSKFGIGVNFGKKATNAGNRLIGLGVTQEVGKKAVLGTASKGQKLLGNTYKYLGAAVTEGLYEEGLQGVAGTTMQNYLKAKYDPDVDEGYGLAASLSDAFAQQYGTKEGWKEMSVGMIIGVLAPALQGQPLGFGKDSYASKRRALGKGVEKVNNGVEVLRNLDRSNTMAHFKTAITTGDGTVSTETANSIINMDFIKTQEHLKTPSRIIEEFDAVVDNMKLDENQIEMLGGAEAAQQYKESLKTEFKEDARAYRAAKSLINSVELTNRTKETPGNIDVIADALITNMVMGNSAARKATIVGKRLDELTGKAGLYDAMKFYNDLGVAQKESVAQLRKKKRRLKDLKKLATKYGQLASGVAAENSRKISNKTATNNYNKYSEKAVLVQQEIIELEANIEDISQALESDFRAVTTGLEDTLGEIEFPVSAQDMVDKIDQIDVYKDALLRVGKTKEANEIDHLTQEFKKYADAHTQSAKDIRSLFDNNFYKTEKASKFFKKVVGKKYEVSEDFKKVLKENSAALTKALGVAGIEGATDIETVIEEAFVKNEEISDREKFRLEAVLRTILGAEKVGRTIEALEDTTEIISSFSKPSSTPLEGDTISLKREIGIKEKDLSNIDILNEVIDTIIKEIDSLRNIRGERDRIEELEARLKTLTETEVEPEIEKGDHVKTKLAMDKPVAERTEEETELLKTYSGLVENQKSINATKNELSALKDKIKFKVAATEEYKKLKDLTEKRRNKTATPEEISELQEIIDEIDDWVLITGTVAEGFRLSDLIRQKLALEETPVTKVPEITTITTQTKIDQIDISDKTGGVSYSYGQTYAGVTAVAVKEGIEISGISPKAFEKLVGKVEYTTNDIGNIIITPEVQAQINAQGVLSILPTNKNLSTSYSIVLKTQEGLDGTQETSPLVSTFNEDFNMEMDADAIYDQEVGGELTLEVNPNDAYNVELLEDYRKAVGANESTTLTDEEIEDQLLENAAYVELLDQLDEIEYQESKATTLKKPSLTKRKLKKKEQIKKKRQNIIDKLTKAANKNNTGNKEVVEEALENLRRGLVIRVKDSEGNFMAVLKSKRSNVQSAEAQKFEALRDQIATDEAFLLRLINTKVSEEIKTVGEVTTQKVLIGHPNFNFIRNEDGSVAIENREVTSSDIGRVTDIGYVENGKLVTKSKDKGINTTFISKSIRESGSDKTPFIVMTKGKTKFAYPVKAVPLSKESTQEFKDIFNSDLGKVEKAIALNVYMAEKGIDIKKPGNSFIGLHKDNLNDKFFNEKLAQLNSIEYFHDLDSWSDPKVAISENLTGKVMVDIKLNDPLHSPKLQMDFSGLNVKTPAVKADKREKIIADKTTMANKAGKNSKKPNASKLDQFKDCK